MYKKVIHKLRAVLFILYFSLFPALSVFAQTVEPKILPIVSSPVAEAKESAKAIIEKAKETTEKIVQPIAEFFSDDSLSQEQQSEPAIDETLFNVVNETTDVAYTGDGNAVYRIYDAPRLLYREGDRMKVREPRWNWFSEMTESQLVPEKYTAGYSYRVPLSEKETITIRSGSYEMGETSQLSQKAVFAQSEKDFQTVTRYADAYQGVDISFIDSGRFRERRIVLKEPPKNLKQTDSIVFWEEYVLPKGSVIFGNNEKITVPKQTVSSTALYVQTPEGNGFGISPAVVFDKGVGETPEERDISNQIFPVTQKVEINQAAGTMRVGLVLPASYLLSAERQYPVTIDPTYWACMENSPAQFTINCGITNFYLRAVNGGVQADGSAWIDNNLFLGSWLSGGNYYTRHPVLFFNTDFRNLPGIVHSAWLKMYYRNMGDGNDRNVDTVARRITQSWNPVWNYGNFRNILQSENPALTIDSQSSGRWITWNVVNSVRAWVGGASNNGLLVEEDPAWPQGNTPPNTWENRLMRFDSSTHGEDTSPYLAILVTAFPPDLTSQGSVINTQDVSPGDAITLNVTVKNVGGRSTGGAADVKYYFKKDSFNDYTEAYRTDTVGFPSLLANETAQASTSYVIPANTVPGTYYFYYFIDANNVIAEGNENNNQFFYAITVRAPQPQLPNLIPEELAIDDNTLFPGQNATVSTRVYNRGNGATVNSSELRYYFSSDALYDGNDTQLDVDDVASLDSGVSSFETTSITIPANALPGANYILFRADAAGQIPESNENDNVGAFQVTIEQLSDPLEPNNSFDRAYNIGDQNSYQNNQLILTAGDEDWFRFNYDNQIYYFKVRGFGAGTAGDYNLVFTRNGAAVTIETRQRTGITDTYLYLYDTDAQSERARDDDNGEDSFSLLVYQFGLCGGMCGAGGGGAPPPSAQLPDTDQDTYANVEEAFVGTPMESAVQTAPLFDTRSASYSSKKVDTVSIAVPPNQAADPVNTRTGSFEFTQTDFSLPGRGIPINFVRTYNSMTVDKNSHIGNGWNFSHNFYYYQDPATNNVQIYLGGTLATIFTTSDNGQTFSPPKGEFDELYWNNAQHEYLIYKTLDGVQYFFTRRLTSQLGILERAVDTNNNTTQFTYITRRDVPLLREISDAAGRRVSLTYGDDSSDLWDKIVELRELVNNDVPRVITYLYDASLNLTSVIDNRSYGGFVENIAKQYAYDNNNRLLTYTDPRGTILYNEYDGQGRVTRQYEHNPRVDGADATVKRLIYELSYDDDGDPAVIGSTHCTLVKNYRDIVNHYDEYSCFNTDEHKIYNRTGDTIESWTYDAWGMVSQKTDGLGNITAYQYDEQRRLTQEVLPNTAEWHTVVAYEYWNNPNRLKTKTETTTSLINPGQPAQTRVTAYTVPQDGRGNTTAINYPLNISEQFTYNPNGTVLNHTDKNGNVTTYEYDPTDNYPSREAITVVQADGSVQNIVSQYLYDVYGNKTSFIDSNTNTHTFRYDTHGNLREAVNPAGDTKLFQYDIEDHKVFETDELGRVSRYTYDTDINASLLSVTKESPTGNISVSRQYDYVGNVKKEIDPLLRETNLAYDSTNRIQTKTDPQKIFTYEYYLNGLLKKETSAAVAAPAVILQRTDYLYDERNNKTEVRKYYNDNNFISNKMEYDGFNRPIKETDGNDRNTLVTYDDLDRVTSKIDPLGGRSEYAYDNNGNTIGERTPRASANPALRNADGYSTSYLYDEANRRIKQTNADNKQTLTFYDPNGNLIRVIDRQNADGTNNTHVTRYTYNNLNRKTDDIFTDNSSIHYDYDRVGNLTAQTDQMGRISTNRYDDFNRLTSSIDPANNTTRYEYDAAGNKTAVVYPDTTRTEYRYDAGNRLEQVIDALGGVKRFTYDAAGNKLTETDKRNFTTVFVYDKLNRLTSETNPQGTLTVHTYDANGNRLSETVGVKTTGYEYDELNRLENITYPGNKTEHSTYDENGNKDSYTDGKDQTINFVYDALNRVSTKRAPNTAPITYSYDNWNNVTRLADESGTTDYTYNALNLLGAETKTITGLPLAKTISRTYNPAGQLATLTDAANRVMTYRYNNRGLLESVNYNNLALSTYAYNNFGKPTSVVFANGVHTVYEYDELNRTKLIETKKADNTSLFKQEYSYDAESNRTQMIENNTSTIVYSYDTLNQLTDVDYQSARGVGNDISFRYDQYGNRTNLTTPFGTAFYAYADNSNELQSVTYNNRLTVSSEFDRNGSLTRETYTRLGRNTKEITYSWDTQNRLSSINYHVSSRPAFLPPLPDNTLNFAYDDAGDRTKKIVNDEASYYINDGLTVLNELDSAGSVTKSIISGLEQIAEIDGNGVITFLHQDILGSTVLLTNQAGEVTQHYEYDPFGQILGMSGIAETKYLFTGQEYDQESELYYYNARYYNPRLGRFISRDPFLGRDGDSLSRNGYTYVKNNPLKYVDPTGNEEEEIKQKMLDAVNTVSNSIGDAWDWTKKSVKEAVCGNWCQGDPTVGGVGLQIGAGLTGADFPLDISNLGYDFSHWEWSWGHAGQTTLDAVGLIPVIGALKYTDEAAALVKGGKKAAKAGFNIPEKIADQMGKRGWTDDLLNSTRNNSFTTREALNKATGNKATAYYNKDGSHVVIDNVTNKIIQISDRTKPEWMPDSTIVNPYKPK